jgi:hypothetical protein
VASFFSFFASFFSFGDFRATFFSVFFASWLFMMYSVGDLAYCPSRRGLTRKNAAADQHAGWLVDQSDTLFVAGPGPDQSIRVRSSCALTSSAW